MIGAKRRGRDGNGSWGQIGVLVVVVFCLRFRGCSGVASERGGQVECKDRVTSFGSAILHNILPLFFVGVFLCLAPGMTSGEINRLRIRGPRKRVNLFLSLSYGECFPALRRDQVNLVGFLVFFIGVIVGVSALF